MAKHKKKKNSLKKQNNKPKMKIAFNLNFLIKDIGGEEIKEEPGKITNAGKLLGNILVGHNKGDALKYYDWGRALHKGEDITVDRSDFDHIIKFVKEAETLSNLSKAQIEIRMKEAETAAVAKEKAESETK